MIASWTSEKDARDSTGCTASAISAGGNPAVGSLYDRFAHALDPFDPAVDMAEKTFNSEMRSWFDLLPNPKPEFREYRRHVIALCRAQLRASDRPPSI
jgi:hypothetical protein